MNYMMMLLQAETSAQVPDVWGQIADSGLSFILLALAVVVLWRRDAAMSRKVDDAQDKLERYIADDRQQMIAVIEHNTKAFEELSRTLERMERQLEKD